jgi:nitrate/TMAO reductase-like tetraheme cytochrome c subunit
MSIGLAFGLVGPLPAFGAEGDAVTFGTFFRTLGIVAAGTAIVALVLVQFVFHDRFDRTTRHWILMVLLLVFPLISVLGTMETVMEETKTVASCNSCHVMEPFVNDLRDTNSPTLASRHFENKWIPKQQCYQCHTTYGVHGTLAAKRDGFRHWLLYVTETYEKPIEYSGSYPNVNCLNCHAGTDQFQSVQSHSSLRPLLASDKVSCTSCHGPAHPPPPDRAVLDSISAPPPTAHSQ